jgi:membrane protease YdiL (CAAX protease family)
LGDLTAPLLLIVALATLAWSVRNSVRNFAAFTGIEDTRRRQRVFLIWAAQGLALYLGMPLIGLALLGRLETLSIGNIPSEFWPVAEPLPLIRPEDMAGVPIGMAIGFVFVGVFFFVRGRRPVRPRKPHKLEPLLARNRAEALALVPLILNAGITEEVFCRLYIPLLMVLSGVDAGIAFVAATLIFGALHLYQGWRGVVATTVLGALFALAYLAADGLWLPVAIHLFINTMTLLIRPAIVHLTRRRDD